MIRPDVDMTTDPKDRSFGSPPRIYRDLADWYPLLTPVAV
jgi:hypothetical protein